MGIVRDNEQGAVRPLEGGPGTHAVKHVNAITAGSTNIRPVTTIVDYGGVDDMAPEPKPKPRRSSKKAS